MKEERIREKWNQFKIKRLGKMMKKKVKRKKEGKLMEKCRK